MLSEFLLPDKSGRRFGNLVRDRGLLTFFKSTGSLSSRVLPFSPLPFRNKEPDRAHQMLGGNVDIPFPEDLRAPISVARKHHESLLSNRLFPPLPLALRSGEFKLKSGINRGPLAPTNVDTSCAFLTGP